MLGAVPPVLVPSRTKDRVHGQNIYWWPDLFRSNVDLGLNKSCGKVNVRLFLFSDKLLSYGVLSNYLDSHAILAFFTRARRDVGSYQNGRAVTVNCEKHKSEGRIRLLA
jgi:hypothetical protein